MSMNRLIRRIEEAADGGVTKFKGKEGFWRTQSDGDHVFLPTEKYGKPKSSGGGSDSSGSGTTKSRAERERLFDLGSSILDKAGGDLKKVKAALKKSGASASEIADELEDQNEHTRAIMMRAVDAKSPYAGFDPSSGFKALHSIDVEHKKTGHLTDKLHAERKNVKSLFGIK
jgi:hypothetical protein